MADLAWGDLLIMMGGGLLSVLLIGLIAALEDRARRKRCEWRTHYLHAHQDRESQP